MPRVTDEYRQHQRDRIRDALIACVRRKGFHRTSMSDVIAESGMSAGAIYGYYKGKSEIIRDVAQGVVTVDPDALLASLGEDLQGPAGLIRAFTTRVSLTVGDHPILLQIWAEAATDKQIAQLIEEIIDRIRDVYEGYLVTFYKRQGRTTAKAKRLAASQAPVMLSLSQGYILQSALVPDFDSDAYFDAVRALFPES